MATFSGWEAAVLKAIGAPATIANVAFLDAWQHFEGGSAANNPLNTTQPAGGATDYNSAGVKNYGSAQEGAQATAQTLQNGRYPFLLLALRSGNPAHVPATSLAMNLHTWGSHSFANALVAGGSGGILSTIGAGVSGAGTIITDPGKAISETYGRNSPLPGVGSVVGGIEDVGSFLGKITSPRFLLQAAQVAAGAGMVLVGMVLLARQVALGGLEAAPAPVKDAATAATAIS